MVVASATMNLGSFAYYETIRSLQIAATKQKCHFLSWHLSNPFVLGPKELLEANSLQEDRKDHSRVKFLPVAL